MLADLVSGAVADAQARQAIRPLAEVEAAAAAQTPALDALAYLAPADRVKIIAEVKRASPSRGPLADIPDSAALAASYQAGGASAISVLTEQRRFMGSLDDLVGVRRAVSLPVLRKDFVTTPYQVVEARAAGADIVLLIVAALDDKTLTSLSSLITEFGMTALVEAHTEDELKRAFDTGSRLVGVNARNLTSFSLDRDLFGRVSSLYPDGVIKVAESAVKSAADVAHYREAGADVVLVGEALVTSDPVQTLHDFLAV